MADAHASRREAGGASPPRGGVLGRAALRVLSPSGARGRLTVLIFHRVRERADPLFPEEMHATVFRERMTWLRAWFDVLPLDEAVVALRTGRLPARAAAITFDDGYADNATVASPILRELGLPATLFVATGFLDGGRMWNDTVIEAIRRASAPTLDLTGAALGVHPIETVEARRAAIGAVIRAIKHLPPPARVEKADHVARIAASELPDDLMLTRAALRSLASAGMGIGAHTIHHPILASVPESEARDEIAGGREALAAIVRQPVTLFAYPNGSPDADYRATHVAMARQAGFTAAFSTAWGAARATDALHELPRFTPWDRTRARFGLRLARNFLVTTRRAS